MTGSDIRRAASAFEQMGFRQTVARLLDEVAALYESDRSPWVVGYSGGKDSTAALQLVWLALSALPEDRLTKPVHVISTDTLVENPIVAVPVLDHLEVLAVATGALAP